MFKNLKIRAKIILITTISALPILAVGYYSITTVQRITQPLAVVSGDVDDITKKTELNDLAQKIKYYDEVLTQSARNYAFTEDTKWKERYDTNVIELDAVIVSAMEKGDSRDLEFFNEIKESNDALVVMEFESIALVDSGSADEAIIILESDEYWAQKAIYSEGLRNYVERRATEQGLSLQSTTGNISSTVSEVDSTTVSYTQVSIVVIAVSFVFAATLGVLISYLLTRPIVALEKGAKEITAGDLTKRVEVDTDDEIGELSKSFNEMAAKVQASTQSLEEKIQERTGELQKLNRYFVGRELKMVELKKEIATLQSAQLSKRKANGKNDLRS